MVRLAIVVALGLVTGETQAAPPATPTSAWQVRPYTTGFGDSGCAMDADTPGGGSLTLAWSRQKPGLTIDVEIPDWSRTDIGTAVPSIIQIDGNASWTGVFYVEPLDIDAQLEPDAAATLLSDLANHGKQIFFQAKFPGGDPGNVFWTINITGTTNALKAIKRCLSHSQ